MYYTGYLDPRIKTSDNLVTDWRFLHRMSGSSERSSVENGDRRLIILIVYTFLAVARM